MLEVTGVCWFLFGCVYVVCFVCRCLLLFVFVCCVFVCVCSFLLVCVFLRLFPFIVVRVSFS